MQDIDKEAFKNAAQQLLNAKIISENQANEALSKVSSIKAQSIVLTDVEIEKLKQQVGQEKLCELEKLLSQIK